MRFRSGGLARHSHAAMAVAVTTLAFGFRCATRPSRPRPSPSTPPEPSSALTSLASIPAALPCPATAPYPVDSSRRLLTVVSVAEKKNDRLIVREYKVLIVETIDAPASTTPAVFGSSRSRSAIAAVLAR
jgi:hypothetical protein